MFGASLVVSQTPERVELSRVTSGGRTVLGSLPSADAFHVSVHPTLPFVYLTSAADGGSIVTLDLNTTRIHTLPDVGALPCFVAVSADGTSLVTATTTAGRFPS